VQKEIENNVERRGGDLNLNALFSIIFIFINIVSIFFVILVGLHHVQLLTPIKKITQDLNPC